MIKRQCYVCKKEKQINDFPVNNSKTGRSGKCRTCYVMEKKMNQYRLENLINRLRDVVSGIERVSEESEQDQAVIEAAFELFKRCNITIVGSPEMRTLEDVVKNHPDYKEGE